MVQSDHQQWKILFDLFPNLLLYIPGSKRVFEYTVMKFTVLENFNNPCLSKPWLQSNGQRSQYFIICLNGCSIGYVQPESLLLPGWIRLNIIQFETPIIIKEMFVIGQILRGARFFNTLAIVSTWSVFRLIIILHCKTFT